MKIYSISVNANTYQWLIPEIDKEQLLDIITFDCYSKISQWPNVNWYTYNPKNKIGNFFTIGNSGAFAFDRKVYESELRTLLEMAGEILPIMVGGQELFILNVLECPNTLDERTSMFHYYPSGNRGKLLQYVFYDDRLTESSLFKIPQTSRSQILTYTGVKNASDEFYSVYHSLKLTGLVFEEIYTSQSTMISS
jgi:hypothetical protein